MLKSFHDSPWRGYHMLGQGRELTGLLVVGVVLLAWALTAIWLGARWLLAQMG